jgi:ATP-binding cassette subfamily B multidrug efflux pump
MNAIRRLLPYLKPYWKPALAAPLLMVLEVAMDLAQPYLIQRIVDNGIASGDMGMIARYGGLMIGAALVGMVGGVGCTYYAVRAAMLFGADLRGGLYRKVQRLSFGNFDQFGTGQLITRLTNDVTQVQDIVLAALRIMVRSPLTLVGSLVMATLTSPRLALLFLFLMPPLALVVYFVLTRSYPLYVQMQTQLDRLNAVMQENLAGIRVVKAFVRSDYEKQRFGAANEALTGSAVAAMQFGAMVGPVMMIMLDLGVISVIWFGGHAVVAGEMTIGQMIAFVNYLRGTLFSLVMFSMLITRISRAQASSERIIEVLDTEPEVQEHPGARTAFQARGRLAFEQVTFGYDTGEPVLRDISFVAEPGQAVAILGATGSGKSTLVSLIPRFYDVDEGRITLDGVDIRELSLKSLRDQIGIALQESVLFSGTILENLGHGREGATVAEMHQAAQAARADRFIRQFAEEYDTVLGQRGVNLSGGQRQRLAIARALVRRPAILILDDSTSAVDVETEIQIHDALDTLLAGCTRIIVAQRISTVLEADKILVLDGGRIVAEGTHVELLRSSAIYREIYDSQLGGGVAERPQEASHVSD